MEKHRKETSGGSWIIEPKTLYAKWSIPSSFNRVSDQRPVPAPQIRCGCFQEAACLGCQESRLGIVAETDNHADLPRVLSFLLSAGCMFYFPKYAVYPEATQRITTRPGTKTPLCHHFLFSFFETSQDVPWDVDLVTRHESWKSWMGALQTVGSASVDLELESVRPFPAQRDHRDSPSLPTAGWQAGQPIHQLLSRHRRAEVIPSASQI